MQVFFKNRPADNLLLLHRGHRAVRNYARKKTRRGLVANLVRRCGLNELDELEGLGLAVLAVDLA
jgi:hypothetical protein